MCINKWVEIKAVTLNLTVALVQKKMQIARSEAHSFIGFAY